jgi:chromosome partitioning protein
MAVRASGHVHEWLLPHASMHTIVIASQKGGVGKTSIARCLAVAAEQSGRSVAIIDGDPQASLSRWFARREAETPRLARLDGRPLADVLGTLRQAGINLTVVDTPPSTHEWVRDLVAAADFVLVATGASPDDLGALPPTVDLIQELERPFAFVVVRVKPRTRLVAEAVRVLAEHGRVAPAILHDRSDHPVAAARGMVPVETDPDGKSASEVTQLWAFVARQLEGKKRGKGRAA